MNTIITLAIHINIVNGEKQFRVMYAEDGCISFFSDVGTPSAQFPRWAFNYEGLFADFMKNTDTERLVSHFKETYLSQNRRLMAWVLESSLRTMIKTFKAYLYERNNN